MLSENRNQVKCLPLLPILPRCNTFCPSQETEVTSTPTRPFENVITTKGLHDRNNLLLDGRTVENKGKLIQTEIFPLVQKHDI